MGPFGNYGWHKDKANGICIQDTTGITQARNESGSRDYLFEDWKDPAYTEGNRVVKNIGGDLACCLKYGIAGGGTAAIVDAWDRPAFGSREPSICMLLMLVLVVYIYRYQEELIWDQYKAGITQRQSLVYPC